MFTSRTVSQYYHQWLKKLEALLPEERKSRIQGLVLLMLGIMQSRSVYLGRVAGEFGGGAKRSSRVQRLWRWLSNSEVAPIPWYEAAILPWLQTLAKQGTEIRLVLDGSKVGFSHQLLLIGVCYRKRVIPLCWQWVGHGKGHSTVEQQIELLKWVKQMLPCNVQVSVVGDSEFGNTKIIRMLDRWEWDYDLRQNAADCVKLSDSTWHRLGSVVKEGQSKDLGWLSLTKKHSAKVYVVLHWEKGEAKPWLIATSRYNLKACLKAYSRRMWIEQTFGDFKDHGFDLEATQLRSADKLNRLTLAICLLYLWLVAFASVVIKRGLRHLVDRTHRRDLSIFRIGYDFIQEQQLQNQLGTLYLHPV